MVHDHLSFQIIWVGCCCDGQSLQVEVLGYQKSKVLQEICVVQTERCMMGVVSEE